MKTRNIPVCLCLVAGLAFAGGFVRPEESSAQAKPARSTAGDNGYSRDSRGNEYFIDDKGALHVIEKKLVVTDELGNKRIYEVRGDEHPRRDASGRLYFSDRDGRIVYIDEGAPGGVIDPMGILKGTEMERKIESGRSMAYCANRYDACRQACREVLPSDREVCLGNCERDKARCGRAD